MKTIDVSEEIKAKGFVCVALTADVGPAEILDNGILDIRFNGHYQDCMMSDSFHDLFTIVSVFPHGADKVNVRFKLRETQILKLLKGHQIGIFSFSQPFRGVNNG